MNRPYPVVGASKSTIMTVFLASVIFKVDGNYKILIVKIYKRRSCHAFICAKRYAFVSVDCYGVNGGVAVHGSVRSLLLPDWSAHVVWSLPVLPRPVWLYHAYRSWRRRWASIPCG